MRRRSSGSPCSGSSLISSHSDIRHRYPVIIDRKIRIAIVGCGRISANHFGSIERHAEHLELAAVCDIDPTVAEEHAQRYRVPAYQDVEEMLTKERLDLVALCTPSSLHPQQTILAARHGVHAVTEKPMATRWKDSIAMVKACYEAGCYSSS